MNKDFTALALQYRSALLSDVIPFWERHSVDRELGGYLTCLDRDGTVYDTDKFVWLQARQVWLFSMLYRSLEQRPAWLDLARHGAEFLRAHGRDAEGNWYFSLARDGTLCLSKTPSVPEHDRFRHPAPAFSTVSKGRASPVRAVV